MSEKKKKKQNSGKFKSLMDHRILVAVLAFGLALILILSTIAPLFAYASEATEETEEELVLDESTGDFASPFLMEEVPLRENPDEWTLDPEYVYRRDPFLDIPWDAATLSVEPDVAAGLLKARLYFPDLDTDAVVSFAVWNEADRQDDLVWYPGSLCGDGLWKVTAPFTAHQGSGTYQVHVYADLEGESHLVSGKSVLVDLSVIPPEFSLKCRYNQYGDSLLIAAQYFTPDEEYQKLTVAVYDKEGSIDEAMWFELHQNEDGDWIDELSLAALPENGTYVVACYKESQAEKVFLASEEIVVSGTEGSIQISGTDEEAATFRILVSALTNPDLVHRLNAAVYTIEGGDDDKIVSEMQPEGDTWYLDVRVADHDSQKGLYHVDVTAENNSGRTYLLGSLDYVVTFSDQKPLLNLEWNPSTGYLAALMENTDTVQTDKVSFAVWTEEDGRDDLAWYEGRFVTDGAWLAEIALHGQHDVNGTIHVECYQEKDDLKIRLGEGTVEVAKTSANVAVFGADAFGRLYNIGVLELSHPDTVQFCNVHVWPESVGQENGMDLAAEEGGEGWTAQLDVAVFQFAQGTYQCEAFVTGFDGKEYSVGTATFEVALDTSAAPELKATVDPYNQILDIRYENAILMQDTEDVEFAVWSDVNGQDDLIYHRAVMDKTFSWFTAFYLSQHQNNTGLYHIIAYHIVGEEKKVLGELDIEVTILPGGDAKRTDTTQLHPELQDRLALLRDLCDKEDLKLGISETLRTQEYQDALYMQGRTEPGFVVTQAMGSSYSSQHQWGIAFDFFRNVPGHAYDDLNFFRRVADLAKSVGLAWGGDWDSFVDMPHLYLPHWGEDVWELKVQYGTPQNFMATWAQYQGLPKEDTQGNQTSDSDTPAGSTSGESAKN